MLRNPGSDSGGPVENHLSRTVPQICGKKIHISPIRNKAVHRTDEKNCSIQKTIFTFHQDSSKIISRAKSYEGYNDVNSRSILYLRTVS